ncbi:MAG TPA: hypothetical protein VMV94_00660 [Phycisphaerae bacterium]|nr:hypothetical protein [Phycisphaerae bacterium]
MTTRNRSAVHLTADPRCDAMGARNRSDARVPGRSRSKEIPAEPRIAATRSPCRAYLVFLLLLIPFAFSGCIQFASAWANITGGDVIEPEFKLTQGPLLVLIEDPRGDVTDPRAIRELHATISDIFLEFKVNNRIIPWEERERLERAEKDYAKLSIREIGEKLGAEQVLYIRVEKFTLQSEPGAPIFKGEFTTRVKVLGTMQEKDVRQWPHEPSGRRFSVSTPAISSEGDKSASDVAKELAIKMGQAITEVFYEHRSFEGKKTR